MALTLAEYESTLFALADLLRSVKLLLDEANEDAARQCQDLLKRLAENRFNIVVAGRFNRGKSSLLNAILGPTTCRPASCL